jgi:ABC-2 type transport system permease protein
MSSFRAAVGAVCRSELLRTLNDRTALFFALLLPVILIGMSAVLFGGDAAVNLAVADPSGTVIAELEENPAVTVVAYDDTAELERDVQTGRADAGLIITQDEDGAVAARFLNDPSRAGTDPARFASRDALRQVAVFETTVTALEELRGLEREDAEAAAVRVSDLAPVTVESTTVGTGQSESQDARSYSSLGNLVLFMFINSLAIGGQLVAARQLGVIRRSLAAPVSAGDLAAGFVVARMVFALIQAGLIVVVGAVFFDVDWGDPVAVAAVVLVFAVVCAAAGLVLGAVAKTPEQAPAIGVPVSIALAMLGGCMWPLFIVPDTVRQIGHLTPHAWAVDGLIEVVFDGGSLGSIGVELAVLSVFATVLSGIAILSLRRITSG